MKLELLSEIDSAKTWTEILFQVVVQAMEAARAYAWLSSDLEIQSVAMAMPLSEFQTQSNAYRQALLRIGIVHAPR